LVAAAIRARGWKVKTLPRKKADPDGIASEAPELIAVAGDGTVAAVLAMLPDRSVPVAIVPTGTVNNIARSLGIQAYADLHHWRRPLIIGEAIAAGRLAQTHSA
jgi:diacylglycerol kinase family enzyme